MPSNHYSGFHAGDRARELEHLLPRRNDRLVVSGGRMGDRPSAKGEVAEVFDSDCRSKKETVKAPKDPDRSSGSVSRNTIAARFPGLAGGVLVIDFDLVIRLYDPRFTKTLAPSCRVGGEDGPLVMFPRSWKLSDLSNRVEGQVSNSHNTTARGMVHDRPKWPA